MFREHQLNTIEHRDGTMGSLNLEGALIAETRYEPERILREWLESGVNQAIIYCAALTHIDSAGLSTLLGALHRYRRQGGDIILVAMNPSLNAIFEVTSMEKYFRIFPTLELGRAHLEQLAEQHKKRAGDRPAVN